MKKEIDKLKDWLLTRGNAAKLTVYLGYNSTNAIDQWVRREKIPDFQVDRVMKFISKKGIK